MLTLMHSCFTSLGAAVTPQSHPCAAVCLCLYAAATQVHADFEYIGQASGLSTVCLYGGTPYGPQEGILRRGVDVVVGTPGRVKDHMERGTLKLNKLRFRWVGVTAPTASSSIHSSLCVL